MGWLHAAPKSKAGINKTDEEPVSRLSFYAKNDVEVFYPPCGMMYMVNYLFSAGPTMPSPMGSTPLTHQEIQAWQHNMGIDLCPWEANVLREISRQYLSELLQSDKHDSPPPWIPELNQEQGEAIVKRVKDVLRG